MNLIRAVKVGVEDLDSRLKLAEWRSKGHIGRVSGSTAARKQGDDAATAVDDGRTRVAPLGECAVLVLVGDDGELARPEVEVGVVDAIVSSDQGLQLADPPRGRARGLAVPDDR